MKRTAKQWITSFFIPTSFRGLTELVSLLSFAAKQAYFARNYKELTGYGNRLISLSSNTESLGQYYLTLAQSRYWSENRAEVKRSFEDLAEDESSYIRAASLLALGGERLSRGKADEETAKLFLESSMIALREKHLLTFAISQSNLSMLCSLQGDHQQSLNLLRGLKPVINHLGGLHPYIATDFNNNISYELLKLGKCEEAKGFALLVLQSPYLSLYPEWQQNLNEIFVKKSNQAITIYNKPSRMPKGKLLKFPIKIIKPEMVMVQIQNKSGGFNLAEYPASEIAALRDFIAAKMKAQFVANPHQSAETI